MKKHNNLFLITLLVIFCLILYISFSGCMDNSNNINKIKYNNVSSGFGTIYYLNNVDNNTVKIIFRYFNDMCTDNYTAYLSNNIDNSCNVKIIVNYSNRNKLTNMEKETWDKVSNELRDYSGKSIKLNVVNENTNNTIYKTSSN